MRILHLSFRLHCPSTDKLVFQKADTEHYQPFFAFLERNAQKYPNFRVSLLVSGLWLEQAEKWDQELLERLKKLVCDKHVELIAVPYYNSLAFFYDVGEFEAEVWLYQERVRELFGAECPIFAQTELIYNNKIGKWAEKVGFKGVLIGVNERTLQRKSPNQVFDAKDCQKLKILVRNPYLSDEMMWHFAEKYGVGNAKSDFGATEEQSDTERMKAVRRSVEKLCKKLELDSLRGGVCNLVLGVEVFGRYRKDGIIRFLDEFLKEWLKNANNVLMTAADICQIGQATRELDVRITTSWCDQETDETTYNKPGLVRLANVEYQAPEWLSSGMQKEVQRRLAVMKPQIFRLEDEELILDFCRLTAVDHLYGMCADIGRRARFFAGYGIKKRLLAEPVEMAERTLGRLQSLQERADKVQQEKIIAIERVVTHKTQREKDTVLEKDRKTEELGKSTGLEVKELVADEGNDVVVNFGAKKVETELPEMGRKNEMNGNSDAVAMDGADEAGAMDDVNMVIADVENTAAKDAGNAAKTKPIRRILRKIVIE